MKNILAAAGTIAIAFGLLFVGQGLDFIQWPSRSFMIGDMNWTYYGGGIAIVGVFLVLLGRRR